MSVPVFGPAERKMPIVGSTIHVHPEPHQHRRLQHGHMIIHALVEILRATQRKFESVRTQDKREHLHTAVMNYGIRRKVVNR